jgi:protein ImuB
LLANASDKINPEFGLEMGWMESLDCSPLAPLDTALPHMMLQHHDGAATSYASLVDRLVARLGYGAVLHLRARACWQPETAQYAAYADMEHAGFEDVMTHAPQSLTAAPRPVRLLGVPQKLAVVALLPDHPPAQFIWQKRTHRVTRASGPERIAPQWWHAAAGTRTRDYFRLQDEAGVRFWVYREGLPERGEDLGWFLHGFFA